MLSGDKGLSSKTLLDPASVFDFVRAYLKDTDNLPKQLVASLNKILPSLEKSAQLTEIYSHPHTLQLLCDAMFSSYTDLHLLDDKNSPAQIDSLWRMLLLHFAKQHRPMRAIYNGEFLEHYNEEFDDPIFNTPLDKLRKVYCDECLFLGYFAFSLMLDNTHQSELSETIAWISKRTSVVVASKKLEYLGKRAAASEEELTVQILNLGVLLQHPCSTQYSFYDERLKWYFAAHFVAACLMRTPEQADLIDDALAASARKFIAAEHENTFLDEFWFHVYAAFPPHTGAHARAEFNNISITTRAESMLYISTIFKLTELELPENFRFQLTLIGTNQFSIKSQKTSRRVNHQVFDFYNNIYVHFESRSKCILITSANSDQLIFTSQSPQEIQNIIFAFKHALGRWLSILPAPLNLFAGNNAAAQASEQHAAISAKHN